MDFYKTLELKKNASQSDIKKAYRKLAKKFHPDKNPNSIEAEQHFKEVSKAYSILSDLNKRHMYDQQGHDAFTSNTVTHGTSRNSNAFDFFDNLFTANKNSRAQRSNNNIRIEIVITIEDTITGTTKRVAIPGCQFSCTKCKGSGRNKHTQLITCKLCNGQGSMTISRGFMQVTRTCTSCLGNGEKMQDPCSKCVGRGIIASSSQVDIKIPKGIKPNQIIHIAGMGHQIDHDIGDLYVVIRIKQNDITIRGNDLFRDMNVSCLVACAGGIIEVQTFEGVKKIKIPVGIQNNSKIKLSNLGLPKSLNSLDRGNFYIIVKLIVPALSNEQTLLIKEVIDKNSK